MRLYLIIHSSWRVCRKLAKVSNYATMANCFIVNLGIVMGKLILMTILVIVSNSAMAEWIGVSSTDDFDTYVDKTTIRKSGNVVKMWILRDYKALQKNSNDAEGNAFFSIAAQQEYDCKEEQARPLSLSYYSKNMGDGQVVYSQTYTGIWQPLVPRSVGQMVWDIACSRS